MRNPRTAALFALLAVLALSARPAAGDLYSQITLVSTQLQSDDCPFTRVFYPDIVPDAACGKAFTVWWSGNYTLEAEYGTYSVGMGIEQCGNPWSAISCSPAFGASAGDGKAMMWSWDTDAFVTSPNVVMSVLDASAGLVTLTGESPGGSCSATYQIMLSGDDGLIEALSF